MMRQSCNASDNCKQKAVPWQQDLQLILFWRVDPLSLLSSQAHPLARSDNSPATAGCFVTPRKTTSLLSYALQLCCCCSRLSTAKPGSCSTARNKVGACLHTLLQKLITLHKASIHQHVRRVRQHKVIIRPSISHGKRMPKTRVRFQNVIFRWQRESTLPPLVWSRDLSLCINPEH